MHSVFSDGSGTPQHIIAAAQQAELDYIIITDHNSLKARERGYEGRYDNLLVSVGEEVSATKHQHCLSIGAKQKVPSWRAADQVVKDIAMLEGISIVAHPHGRYKRWKGYRAYPWRTWEAPFDGIELWSYMWDWIKDTRYYNPFNFLPRYLNPDRFIHGPHPETLSKWDELTQHRRVVAIGGLDVHARSLAHGLLVIFPYQDLFQTLLTYVLKPASQDSVESLDHKSLYDGLRAGHCYISYELLHAGRGFMFTAQNAQGDQAIMGDTLPFSPPVILEIKLPRTGEIDLIRNGELFNHVSSQNNVCSVHEPGVYRVEVRIDGRPWIYSNPIYIS